MTAGIALAIGIGANSALFSVVNAVLLKPLPFGNPARLVAIHENVQRFHVINTPLSTIEFTAFQNASKSYEAIGAYETVATELSSVSPAETLNGVKMTARLFDALAVSPEIGRPIRTDEDFEGSNAIVISDALWARRFGRDPGIVGRNVMLDRKPRVVLGVMPASFTFPLPGPSDNNVRADVFLPMAFTAAEKAGRGPILQKSVIGRLKEGVSIQQANAEAAALASTVHAELQRVYSPRPAYEMTFGVRSLQSEAAQNVSRILLLLSCAVGALLLIACANVANLTLTRAAERRREQAIRAAMGASRADLIRLSLIESFVLSGGSGIAGVGLASLALKFFSAYVPDDLPRADSIGMDVSVVMFTIGIAAATAILSGIAAALTGPSGLTAEALRVGGRSVSAGKSRHRVLSILVSAQFALTVILLIGGTLAFRSLMRTIQSDPGFRREQVTAVTTHLPASFYANAAQIRALYLRVTEEAERIPGGGPSGMGSELPLGTWEKGTITAENSESGQSGSGPIASQIWITGHYLEALGVPLKAGRMLEDVEYRENRGVVIINDVLAHVLWPGQNAVGRRVHNSRSEWATVVGVVGGVKEIALNHEPPPQIYEPHSQVPDRLMEAATIPFFKTLNLVSRAPIRQLTGVIQKADTSLAISSATSLGEVIENSSRPQRLNTFLVVCFAAIAFVLAALGVASVLSYSVTQRRQEIGIRMALGATPSSISGLVLGRGLTLAVVGIAAGLIGALGLTKFITAFLYGVSPQDPLTFVLAPAVLIAVAVAAAGIPARRAARVDPMDSLRAGG